MMKGKLMKSLFRGKGVPRTPGPGGSEEDLEPDRVSRLRYRNCSKFFARSAGHINKDLLGHPVTKIGAVAIIAVL